MSAQKRSTPDWVKYQEAKMIRFAALTMIPIFAGFLYAQQGETTHSESHSSTTRTTYNGTLVDAGCYATHTEHHESSSTTLSDQSGTSRSESSHSETTNNNADCPVTTSSTSFGLLTPDGRYVRFDAPSNTRIVETVKTNKSWSSSMNDHKPIRVQVVGTPNGDVVVLDSIR
jgi:hypothetical protein